MYLYPHMYLNESILRVKYLFDLSYLSCTRTSNATHGDLSDVSLNSFTRRSNSCAKFSFPVTSNLLAWGLWERIINFYLRVDRLNRIYSWITTKKGVTETIFHSTLNLDMW